MKVLAAIFECAIVALSQATTPLVHADPGSEESVVESVLITENGTPIGSLRNPNQGARLIVDIKSGDHQIQATVQLNAVPGERFLLLTGLEDAVITGLSEQGVVGEVLNGGWSINTLIEQKVFVSVVGRHPVAVDQFDLLEAIAIEENEATNEFRVEARVVRPVLPFPRQFLVAGAGAGAAVVAIPLILLWRRSRSGTQRDWNY